MAFSRKLDKSRLCHAEPFDFAQGKLREASLLRCQRLFGHGKTLLHTAPVPLWGSDMMLVLEKTMPGGFPYLFAETENIYTLRTVLQLAKGE
jgi:hypothetical protein